MAESKVSNKDTIKIRVYYEDTDCGGVVYYGRYLGYLERARTEWLRNIGISLEQYHQQGFVFVVAHCDIKYKGSAKYDDELTVETELTEMGGTKLIFASKVLRPDGSVCVEGVVTTACINAETGKPTRIPEAISNTISGN